MVLRFDERSGDLPSGRFAADVGEWTRNYVLYNQDADGTDLPVTTAQLTARIEQVIGTTRVGPAAAPLGAPAGAGSMVRVMPMADPQFLGLFADVVGVRPQAGEGYVSGTADPTGLAVPPAVPGFSQLKGYDFAVSFGPRPYALLPDERMTAGALDWYDVDGSRKRLTYYPEWLRFTQYLVDDLDSRISASVGSAMKYRVPSGSPPGVDGSTFTGIPDMIVPDTSFKMRVYGVPLRYLASASSFLVRFKGRINQTEFQTPWGTYVKGSLLYVGPRVIRSYTPPQFKVVAQADPAVAGSFYAQPLIDVELSFIFTARRRYAPEAGPGDFTQDPDAVANAERPNNNWVDGPHNWMPNFASRRFFYAHAATDPDKTYSRWTPYYLSAPIPYVLFQDPDVPGVIIDL